MSTSSSPGATSAQLVLTPPLTTGIPPGASDRPHCVLEDGETEKDKAGLGPQQRHDALQFSGIVVLR